MGSIATTTTEDMVADTITTDITMADITTEDIITTGLTMADITITDTGLTVDTVDTVTIGDTVDTVTIGDIEKKVIAENYTVQADDYYIEVNSPGPITITLPEGCIDDCKLVIKAEMGPPIGIRKITVVPFDDTVSLINGDDELTLDTPYETLHLTCNNGNWWAFNTREYQL